MPVAEVHHAPVAIAGGGPVGLMLALFLDRYGVRSVVFNSETEARLYPKGSTHNSRTMEHHRTLGYSEKIRDLSLPRERPTDVSYYTRLTGWELGRIHLQSEADKRRQVAASAATDQVPEPLLRGNQMYVEAFLVAHARTRPNITVRFGWNVTSFKEDADGVTVEAEPAAGGTREVWRAKYLAGCDGGRSLVRRSLALHYNGFGRLDSPYYGGPMIATYLRAPTLYKDHLARRHGWVYRILNTETCPTIISLNRDDEFLVFSKSPEDGTIPSDHTVAQMVQRVVGVDLPIQIIGHRPWTAGVALVAERFLAGRVVLAGDAAHLFTPTGGFGMNTGMDDTSNLAWKLAALVQGWGGSNLLQSYEIERRPVAQRNTIAARDLGKQLINFTIPKAVEEDSPDGDAARRSVKVYVATLAEEYASIGVQLGARYDGSPIIVPDGTPPSDDYLVYRPSSVPGGRAPHYWLDAGRARGSSLFDRLGTGFTLLRLGGKTIDTAVIEAEAKKRGIPLTVLDVPAADVRDLYGCALALIRPDQYVAWRGNASPSDAGRIWQHVTGAA